MAQPLVSVSHWQKATLTIELGMEVLPVAASSCRLTSSSDRISVTATAAQDRPCARTSSSHAPSCSAACTMLQQRSPPHLARSA